MSFELEEEQTDIFNEKCPFCQGKYVYDSTDNIIYCEGCNHTP